MRGPLPLFVLSIVLFGAGARGGEGLIHLSPWNAEATPIAPGEPIYQPSAWTPPQAPLPAQSHLPAQAPLPAQVQAESWPGPSVCEGTCFDFDICRLPCFYTQLDGLYWHRVGGGCTQVLVIDTNDDSTLASTRDLDFNLAPGMRFLVGWQPSWGCGRCCAWELSYFGIFDWNARADVVGDGNLAIPGDLGLGSGNFFGADEIGLRYRAEMHNVELNCIKSCCLDGCTRIDFLAGFRYISLDEDFSIIATDFQEGTSSYDINADNDLFGLQLGGRLTRGFCRWSAELTAKAAIFYNDAHQRQIVTDFPFNPEPFVLRDARGYSDGVAMLGELGVVLIRPINDRWSLRVGYNVLGLGGVALAPDQLDFTDTFDSGRGLNRHGWILAHGGLVGLQAAW
jgi:hypothetical protein